MVRICKQTLGVLIPTTHKLHKLHGSVTRGKQESQNVFLVSFLYRCIILYLCYSL